MALFFSLMSHLCIFCTVVYFSKNAYKLFFNYIRYNCSVNDCPKQFHRLDHLAIHLKKSHAEDAEAQGSNFHTLLSMAAGEPPENSD